MANCSVCNKPTSSTKSPVIAADDFRPLVRNGFLPDEPALQAYASLHPALIDAPLEKIRAQWIANAEQTHQDWLLCPECTARMKPYRPQAGKSKPWWLIGLGALAVIVLISIILAVRAAPKQKAVSIRNYKVAKSSFTSLDFSPDGTILATGSSEHFVDIWDTLSAQKVRSLRSHEERVNSVVFSPDGSLLASGSNDRTVCLWAVSSGELLHTLRGHSLAIVSLAFSPDGKTLASVDYGRSLYLWDAVKGEPISTRKDMPANISSLAFSRDGKQLAMGGLDGNIYLLDAQSLEQTGVLNGGDKHITSLAISPDGQTLAAGSDQGLIKLWNPTNSSLIRQFSANQSRISSLDFSPDGILLASGGEDGIATLWNLVSGKAEHTLVNYEEEVFPISQVSFSTDGTKLAISNSFDAKIWDMNDLP